MRTNPQDQPQLALPAGVAAQLNTHSRVQSLLESIQRGAMLGTYNEMVGAMYASVADQQLDVNDPNISAFLEKELSAAAVIAVNAGDILANVYGMMTGVIEPRPSPQKEEEGGEVKIEEGHSFSRDNQPGAPEPSMQRRSSGNDTFARGFGS